MASPRKVDVLGKEMIPALTVQPVRRNRVVATMSVLSVVSGTRIGRLQVIAQTRVNQGPSATVIILNVVNGPRNVRHMDRNEASLATESKAYPVPSPAVPQVLSSHNKSVTGLRRQNGKRQSEQSLYVNRLGQLTHWCDNLAPRVWMRKC